jgi:hypothetical protein
MKVPIITERDRDLLQGLLKCPGMTLQTAKSYFPGKNSERWNGYYTYRRVKLLGERGYLKRIGSNLYISDKGIELITGSNSISSNKLVRKKMNDHYDKLGRLYTSLRGSGWEYLNSREIKAQYRLNRTERIDGGLRYGDDMYAFYLLSDNPIKRTILKIRTEIKRHKEKGLYNTIIFCTTPNTMRLFIHYESKYDGANRRLMLLPLPFGVNLLKKIVIPGSLDGLYRQKLGNFETMPANREFSEQVIRLNDGREYYLTELLTNDLVVKYHLKQYAIDRARLEERGVILFAFESQHVMLSEDFAAYPHIEIVTVPDSWVTDREL